MVPAASIKLEAVIDRLNQYALGLRNEVVLIIDTFEQFRAIEDWLRNHFLGRLNERVKVVTAGRYALAGEWLRGDWNLLVRNVELKPLSYTEMVQYTQIRGIMSLEMTEALARFSKGVPLALSPACEIIVRNGNADFISAQQQHRMIGLLARELTRDINDTDLQQYIEAASMLWKFDQDLLAAVIGRHIPSDKFREFCGLPFVTLHEQGWSLHDSVRQWISIDFRQRMPERFQQYRHLALEALRKRVAEHPTKETSTS